MRATAKFIFDPFSNLVWCESESGFDQASQRVLGKNIRQDWDVPRTICLHYTAKEKKRIMKMLRWAAECLSIYAVKLKVCLVSPYSQALLTLHPAHLSTLFNILHTLICTHK